MSSITMTTDEALIEQTRTALTSLTEQPLALPDEGDLATPNERQRVWQQRQTLNKHHVNVTTRLNLFAAIGPRIDPLRMRGYSYRAVQIELKKALAELEAIKEPHGGLTRQMEMVRESLRILDYGPGSGPEFMHDLLYNRLQTHGIKPVQGRVFNGNGGLVSVDAQLVALEKDHTEARRHLVSAVEAAATEVEKFAGQVTPSATFTIRRPLFNPVPPSGCSARPATLQARRAVLDPSARSPTPPSSVSRIAQSPASDLQPASHGSAAPPGRVQVLCYSDGCDEPPVARPIRPPAAVCGSIGPW